MRNRRARARPLFFLNDDFRSDLLVLRQDKEFGLEVVDLAKDPLPAGPLARSTTRNLNLDKALVTFNSLQACIGCIGRLNRSSLILTIIPPASPSCQSAKLAA
jgi:hypothetical protein